MNRRLFLKGLAACFALPVLGPSSRLVDRVYFFGRRGMWALDIELPYSIPEFINEPLSWGYRIYPMTFKEFMAEQKRRLADVLGDVDERLWASPGAIDLSQRGGLTTQQADYEPS